MKTNKENKQTYRCIMTYFGWDATYSSSLVPRLSHTSAFIACGVKGQAIKAGVCVRLGARVYLASWPYNNTLD